MNMMKHLSKGWIFAASVIVFSAGANVRAYDYYGSSNSNHFLSAAGGIAMPSFNSAVFENPAGLSQIDRLRVNGEFGSDFDGLSNPTIGGGLLWGNQTFGLAGGVSHATAGNGSTEAYYGLGVYASAIKTSLGVSGFTPLSPSGSSNFNAGLLIGATPFVDLGFDAIGLNGGPSEYGFGLAYHWTDAAAFVTDVGADKSFNHVAAEPALLVGTHEAAVTVGYGFSFTSGGVAVSQIADGISVGGGLNLGNVSLQLYYKHLMRYYAALSIAL